MDKLDNIYVQGTEGVVPVHFLTGIAGSGKTFAVKQSISNDPKFGILAATTGIAAVNLGTVTINNVLRYFDTKSLEQAFFEGWLQKTILKIAGDYKWLVIDEVSMLDGAQLDIIYHSVKMVNEMRDALGDPPLGILLTGDFCQLPPIKCKWAFEAECWPFFEASTERLTKCWRQSDPTFLEAINHIRSGRGIVGATLLHRLGVEFVKSAEVGFTGTTIIAKNAAVDNFNWLAHSRIAGVPNTVVSNRWMVKGRPYPSEWSNIPTEMKLKVGAYVMLLSNETLDFTYVNGDCGHIVDFSSDPTNENNGVFTVKLVRTGEEVKIGRLIRYVAQKEPPDELLIAHPGVSEDDLKALEYEEGMPYWEPNYGKNGGWIVGAITFFPLRLAYASTVHKTQGLTLDRVQIDLYQNFMNAPAMVYVALSRCKTPQGLRIIGSPALLGSRVKTDPAVLKWL